MTLDGTRSFIIGTARSVVIDPGPEDDAHLGALLAALGGAAPVAIVLTHAHADHSAAAPALRARCGNAPIRMAPGALALPFSADRVDGWLADGDVLETDAGPLRVVATPGHAPEHIALAWLPADAKREQWFVGDLLMGEGDTALVAAPEGDMAAYLDSLRRVQAAAPAVLYPAHGPPLREPRAAIERYRRHRTERIAQVAAARARRPGATAADLVPEVYGAALAPSLRHAAVASITAILHYLEQTSAAADADARSSIPIIP